jgi:hypothetical protein
MASASPPAEKIMATSASLSLDACALEKLMADPREWAVRERLRAWADWFCWGDTGERSPVVDALAPYQPAAPHPSRYLRLAQP